MSMRSLLMLVIGIVVVLFVGANWALIVQPADLLLGFATIRAPLGLVLLGMMAVLSLMFIAFIAYLQSTVLVESRKHTKELNAQRELADKAEASRFTDLKTYLATEIENLHQRMGNDRDQVLAEAQKVKQQLLTHVEEQSNSLAAAVAQLGDGLNRHG